jgi:hypothetical protein
VFLRQIESWGLLPKTSSIFFRIPDFYRENFGFMAGVPMAQAVIPGFKKSEKSEKKI